MKLWPRIRESLIALWHKTLDYDRKIPRRRRAEAAVRRADAKAVRLRRDEAWTHIRERQKAARLASQQTQVIVPEVVRPQRAIRADYAERSSSPLQLPQVVYVHAPQAPQTTVIVKKSTGCADGCVIVLAILIGLAVLMGGCSVIGIGALIDSAEPTHETEDQSR